MKPILITTALALALAFGVSAPTAAAHPPEMVDGPVCHAVVGDPPVPGIYMVAVAAVDCRQQPDQLRWVGTLQFQTDVMTPWISEDSAQLDRTFPLHQSAPLSARCKEGYWRKMVEVWEVTAGKPWHGRYFSDEQIVHRNDCIEHTHML